MTSYEIELPDTEHKYESVNIAGSFNNWDKSIDSLKYNDLTKKWVFDLYPNYLKNLKFENNENEIKYLYKFVINDSEWICDLYAPCEDTDDGFKNNFINIKKSDLILNNDNNKENELKKDIKISTSKLNNANNNDYIGAKEPHSSPVAITADKNKLIQKELNLNADNVDKEILEEIDNNNNSTNLVNSDITDSSNTPELSAVSSPPSSAPELETNENTDDTDDYDAGPEAPEPTLKDVRAVIEDSPDSIATEVETETENENSASQPEEKTVKVPIETPAIPAAVETVSSVISKAAHEPLPVNATEPVEEAATETVPETVPETIPETFQETTADIPGGFTEQPVVHEISVPATSESAIAPNTASSSTSGSQNNSSSQGFKNIFSLSKFLTSFDWFVKYIILFKVFGIKSTYNSKKDQNKKTTTTSTTAANN
ncbi:hypothetical protein B5S28_g1856 [[Candida] boidinii]|nr:hypothetical protein B5S28_g1856 [[Candida] boidinii]OWB74599.1 hypothetical protein B5S31_g4407 [[Candida] boidinii]OWB76503.1 hypothetical protein B5S32_g655 [[Candida] boidinii]